VGRRTVIRVASKRTCTRHKGERLHNSGKDAEKVIVDLNFAKSGCRKMVIKYGDVKPVAPNTKPDGSDDPEGRQKNRRVEITLK
jgi:OOP family OmpA-OmpF porin